MYRTACKVSPLALYLPFFRLQRPYAISSDVAHPNVFYESQRHRSACCSHILRTILYAIYLTFLYFLHFTALSASHCNTKANKWFCILHAFEIELTFMTESYYVSITSV